MFSLDKRGFLQYAFGPLLIAAVLTVKAQSSTPFSYGLEYPLLVAGAALSAFMGGFISGLASVAMTAFYYLYGGQTEGALPSGDLVRIGVSVAGQLAVVAGLSVSRRWARGRQADRAARVEAVRSEKATARRLAVLQATSQALTQSRTIDEASQKILEAICQSLHWELGALWTVDPIDNVLRCVTVWHVESEDPQELAEFAKVTREDTFEPGDGLPGRVWSSGAPAWIPDVVHDRYFPRAQVAAEADLHGALGFPISRRGEILGVVEFFSREIQQPDEGLLESMFAIGNQIGLYLDRLRAEEAVRQSEALKGATLEAAPDCIITLDNEGRILEFNPAAERTFGYPREDVMGKKIDGTILRSLRSAKNGFTSMVNDPETGIVGRPIEVTAVRSDGEEILVELALRAVEPGAQSLYTAFLRDITQERRAAEARTFLSDVGGLLTSSLNHAVILRRVAERSIPFLGDCCLIDSIEAGDILERVAAGLSDRLPAASLSCFELYLEKPYEQHPVIKAIRSGRTEVVTNFDESVLRGMARDTARLEELKALGLESLIVAPLMGRGRRVGAITFLSVAGGRRLDDDDVGLVEELAIRVGAAIDNALLYREKSRIARTLQQSLLPLKMPKIPGLDVAATYHAAGEGHDVGGDFYDVFQYGNHWAVVVGDVSGRGASAAALTGLVRYTVRSEAMQEKEPPRIISVLNEAIISQTRDEQFCTLTFARVDLTPQGAHLSVVCAGHPEPIVLRAGGGLERVPQTGALLGAYPVELVEQLVDLGKGDSVVFYTDGVIEARSSTGESFGYERLQELIGSCNGAKAATIARKIEGAVLDFAGNSIQDDTAILVLRVA